MACNIWLALPQGPGIGSVERLAWAKANGCPWVARTCAAVAQYGDLEVLQWAHLEQGCPWDVGTCRCAAEFGDLEMLKWARENDGPWNAWMCARAAMGGHLALLKWAREHDCPWDATTCARAAWNGHLESAEVGTGSWVPVERA